MYIQYLLIVIGMHQYQYEYSVKCPSILYCGMNCISVLEWWTRLTWWAGVDLMG